MLISTSIFLLAVTVLWAGWNISDAINRHAEAIEHMAEAIEHMADVAEKANS